MVFFLQKPMQKTRVRIILDKILQNSFNKLKNIEIEPEPLIILHQTD